MALDTGKKQIKIQRTIGEIPYVEAKSKFSIAVDSFAPTLNRMQNEHAATAQANYFQKFQGRSYNFLLLFHSPDDFYKASQDYFLYLQYQYVVIDLMKRKYRWLDCIEL